ncbi:MAG: FkbM family methyltransferase [Lachnospiraceae bacterium]|nr:FkbM family methyltransferase [Lachnospiraceae bacterium]
MAEMKYESFQRLCDQFSKETLRQELRKAYQPYIDHSQNVYIWGTGLLGRFACKQLQQLKLFWGGVIAFIDNNKVMTGTLINDVPVISSDMVETDDVIIICSKSFIDIESQIKKELPNPSLSYHILPLLDDRFKEWGTALLDSLNKLDIYREDYKKMFIKCADDISREILDCILNYRFTMKSIWIQKAYDITIECGDGREYFDSGVMKLHKDEVFVDCGGYIGDTVLEFVKNTDDIYKKIYFFEPGMEVYSKAKRNLKNVHDVLFTQAGVGEKAGVLQFSGEDDFGHIDDNGMETINIVMLDEVVEDQPTFIKMDIEGAELSALKGASKLIKKHRPKLAICVYHKPEDLFEILELIDSFGINYKYYFRHYTNRVSGTILYCIPQSE